MSSAQVAPQDQLIHYLGVLVIQTLFYGVYSVIIFLSTRMLIKRGLKTRAHKILLTMTLFLYLLSGAYWAYCIVDVIGRIENYVAGPQAPPNPKVHFLPLFNALILINYVVNDGAVYWRVRLVCAPAQRKYLYASLFFMIITALCTLSLIGLRIASYFPLEFRNTKLYERLIDMLQVSGMCTSFISNLSATAVIGVAAWRHRQIFRSAFNKSSQANQILLLLLESGLVFAVVQILGLAAALIRLPYHTLGDFFLPMAVQIAAAYTPVILLLVNSQKSLNEATFLETIPESTNPSMQSSFVDLNLAAKLARQPGGFLSVEQPGTAEGEENKRTHRYQASESTLV